MMDYWVNILEKLRIGKNVAVLYVLNSKGSSPGRQGFRMMATTDGYIQGSIGGGIMEHKLVEYTITRLKAGLFSPFLKHQIHQSDIPKDRSGMICSGEQTVAFYCLTSTHIDVVQKIIETLRQNSHITIKLTEQAFGILDQDAPILHAFQSSPSGQWKYTERLGFKEGISIIGAGHVSLALSEVMYRLGFFVEVIDDRAELNTFSKNTFAHKKTCIPFSQLGDYLKDKRDSFVAIMTFGYRSDEECIKQLLGHTFKYIGVMGSKEKMKQLLGELKDQGYSESEINRINTPIGLSIHSKTPMEIAVSIAAEIISIKNS